MAQSRCSSTEAAKDSWEFGIHARILEQRTTQNIRNCLPRKFGPGGWMRTASIGERLFQTTTALMRKCRQVSFEIKKHMRFWNRASKFVFRNIGCRFEELAEFRARTWPA